MENDHDHAAMTFRLDRRLRDDLAEVARARDRSIAAELRQAIRAHLQAEREAVPAGAPERGGSTTTVEGAA